MDLKELDSVWDILNNYVEPKKYNTVLIKTKILKHYNLVYFKSDNKFKIGIILSDFFLNSLCQKMYKTYICNTIINIRYDHIQEILID